MFFTGSVTKTSNRRIVIKSMDDDSTSAGSTVNNTTTTPGGANADDGEGKDSTDNTSSGSRTVRGSYRPPLPSDGAKPSRPFGFHIFSKRKNQPTGASDGGVTGEDSFSTVQMSSFVNDHTAGYGRSISAGSGGGQQRPTHAYGNGNVTSSSSSTGSGGYELSQSQREALKVPIDLYQAAASMFGSTFMNNHVNNNTNVNSSNYSSSNDRRYAHGMSHGLYSSVSTVGDDDGVGYSSGGNNNNNNIHNLVEESLNL